MKFLNFKKKLIWLLNYFIKQLKIKIKFLCGNGGSASDAEHLSTEFLVRLRPKINENHFNN